MFCQNVQIDCKMHVIFAYVYHVSRAQLDVQYIFKNDVMSVECMIMIKN